MFIRKDFFDFNDLNDTKTLGHGNIKSLYFNEKF